MHYIFYIKMLVLADWHKHMRQHKAKRAIVILFHFSREIIIYKEKERAYNLIDEFVQQEYNGILLMLFGPRYLRWVINWIGSKETGFRAHPFFRRSVGRRWMKFWSVWWYTKAEKIARIQFVLFFSIIIVIFIILHH